MTQSNSKPEDLSISTNFFASLDKAEPLKGINDPSISHCFFSFACFSSASPDPDNLDPLMNGELVSGRPDCRACGKCG